MFIKLLKERSNRVRVYVMGGYSQNGGTYMAYHLGRICHEYFGLPVWIVGSKRPSFIYFNYPYDFPVISLEKMEREIREKDIFICNPSFSSYMFGLRLSGKKICYVQHITTFDVLDAFFDSYIFVSNFVRDFVLKQYGIEGPVVNAFINTEIFNDGCKWDRRKNSVMTLLHKNITLHLLDKIKAIYRQKYPSTNISFETYHNLSQKQFAETLKNYKYYLTLSPSEGFGLPALEAMASGCAVVGFDAWGGRDYFEHNMNAMVTEYPRLETVADYLFELTQNEDKARRLAENACITAQRFNQKRFDEQWVDILRNLIRTD